MSGVLKRGRTARRSVAVAVVVGGLVAVSPAALAGGSHDRLRTVVDGLDGPRGVAETRGKVVVAENDGSFSQVKKRRGEVRVRELGSVPATGIAPAVDIRKDGKVFILTTGTPPDAGPVDGAATLYKWRKSYDGPRELADIAAYQLTDPDPDDQEGLPTTSNPFGVAALRDGSVLVSDAEGNDLLRVYSDGDVETVARLKPRVVPVPDGLPPPPDFPPAGTMIPSEAVATSVTVGSDGYWYVGELRGFPATPGTSQIWRIKPGTTDAVCDPENPDEGRCKRYADGLTSIVDLSAGKRGKIYAVSLSKMSWLQMELGLPGSEVGGLFEISRHGKKITELAEDQLIMPAGADVSRRGKAYLTAPIFGPGALMSLSTSRHHHHHDDDDDDD